MACRLLPECVGKASAALPWQPSHRKRVFNMRRMWWSLRRAQPSSGSWASMARASRLRLLQLARLLTALQEKFRMTMITITGAVCHA